MAKTKKQPKVEVKKGPLQTFGEFIKSKVGGKDAGKK